jgi:hypothetical protein
MNFNIAADGILSWRRDTRCRFASVVSCAFPGVMNLESASRRQALRRSTSFFQDLVLWLPSVHVRFIWNLKSVSRRQAAVCQRRVLCGLPRLMYIII